MLAQMFLQSNIYYQIKNTFVIECEAQSSLGEERRGEGERTSVSLKNSLQLALITHIFSPSILLTPKIKITISL